MAERRTLVSIDLDDVGCYHAIHGLEPPDPATESVVLERCLPRFLELFDALGIRATFFVIGRDLERDQRHGGAGAAVLRAALDAGHELANHSFAHAYDLVRWPAAAVRGDIEACDAKLRELGADPRGFRAPGYTHDAALLEQVRAVGYAYDSSCLPSPPYYAAKLGAIGMYALVGRRSHSMVRGARSFFGPTTPSLRDDGLWELPISVTPRARIPIIGTTLLSGPPLLARHLAQVARGLEYLHLELHGIDLADPERDGYAPALRRRQPELRTPLALKRERLAAVLAQRGPTTRLCDAVT